MSANVVEMVLRLKNEASPALKEATRDATAASTAGAEAARVFKEAGQEQATAVRATATAGAELAKSTAAAAPALEGLADSAAKASTQVGIGRNQMISLKAAIGDTVGSLVAGQNPFTVIMQQGPQAASALFTLDNGIQGVAGSLRATMLPALMAAGPIIAALTIAAEIGAIGWISYKDGQLDAEAVTSQLGQAHIDAAGKINVASFAATELATAWKGFASLAGEIQTELRVINGLLDEQDVAAAKRAAQLREAADPGLRSAGRTVAEIKMALAEAQRLQAEGSFDERVGAAAEIAKNTEKLKAANEVLAAHKQALAEALQGSEQIAEMKRAEGESADFLRKRTEAEAEARKRAAEAARIQADAARYATERLREAAAVGQEAARAQDAYKSAQAGLKAFADLSATQSQKINDLAQEKIAKALELYAITQDQVALEKALAGIEADRGKALTAASETPTAAPAAAGESNGQAVAAGISGGPQAGINALAAAGPVGAIIAALANMVVGLEDTIKGFSDFHMQFSETIGKLPEIIFSHLEETLASSTQAAIEMIPNFVNSLAESLPGLLESIVEGLPEVFGTLIQSLMVELPEAVFKLVDALVQSLPKFVLGLIGAIINAIPQIVGAWIDQMITGTVRIVDAIVKMFTQIFQDILGTGEGEGKTFNQGGIFDQIFTGKKEAANGTEGPGLFQKGGWFDNAGKDVAKWVGSFDTGSDMITKTGFAMVHQGERIVNSTGTSSGVTGSMASSSGGGGIHVYMPPGLIIGTAEETAREVGRSAGRGIGSPL